MTNHKIVFSYKLQNSVAHELDALSDLDISITVDGDVNIFQLFEAFKRFVLGVGYSEKSWNDGIEYNRSEKTDSELESDSYDGFSFALGK